jgi:hypothetical protein
MVVEAKPNHRPRAQKPPPEQRAGTVTVPALPVLSPEAASISMLLEKAKRFLEPEVDIKKLADPRWLADPENQRAAMIMLKLAAHQMDVALRLLSEQLEAGSKWRSREAENAERDRVLSAMASDLRD